MNLSYEYNEYVIGYVVTNLESGESINFQFDKVFSNHPEPDYVLKYACEGDDTYRNFNEEEREIARDWLRSHDEVKKLEKAFTKAMYEDEGFKNKCAPIFESEILYPDEDE